MKEDHIDASARDSNKMTSAKMVLAEQGIEASGAGSGNRTKVIGGTSGMGAVKGAVSGRKK